MGGEVPPFATGAHQWGELVSGGSRNPEPQRPAVPILDAQIERAFSLAFVLVPRDQNSLGPVRAGRISVARGGEPAAPPHGAGRRGRLPGRCAGPLLERALRDRRQPAAARGPAHGPLLLAFIVRPEADWTDSLAGPMTWPA